MQEEAIGFIGLGIMGRPMAVNLVRSGHRVIVNARGREAVGELAREGAESAELSRDVARQQSDWT